MSVFRRAQHVDHLPVTTSPEPPADVTRRFPAVTLIEDPATETFTPPVFHPAPAPSAPPAPTGPASLPPLPAGRHRQAWVPAPAAPAPRGPRITEPAAWAAAIAAAWPGMFTVPCGTCHRVHSRGGTASFTVLYAEAERAGWRQDTLGKWACPACQAKPGWRAPNTPILSGEYLEDALARDVAAHAADMPLRDTFTQALRHPRYYLNASALGVLNVSVLDKDEEGSAA